MSEDIPSKRASFIPDEEFLELDQSSIDASSLTGVQKWTERDGLAILEAPVLPILFVNKSSQLVNLEVITTPATANRTWVFGDGQVLEQSDTVDLHEYTDGASQHDVSLTGDVSGVLELDLGADNLISEVDASPFDLLTSLTSTGGTLDDIIFNSSAVVNITRIDLGGNSFQALGVSGFTSLVYLDLRSNNLLGYPELLVGLENLYLSENFNLGPLVDFTVLTNIIELELNNTGLTGVLSLPDTLTMTRITGARNEITQVILPFNNLISYLDFNSNLLSIEEQNSILQRLDASGVLNGFVDITNNLGDFTDFDSATSLQLKGWNIVGFSAEPFVRTDVCSLAPDCIAAWEFEESASRNGAVTFSNSIISSDLAKNGTGSAKVDNDSAGLMSFVDSNDWDLLSQEFTIEGNFRFSIDPTTGRTFLISHGGLTQASSVDGWSFAIQDGDTLKFSNCTGAAVTDEVTASLTFLNGVWYHLAAVRTGNSVQLYINGVATGSPVTFGAIVTSAVDLRIGAAGDATNTATGSTYVSDVTITQKPKYSADFTPATVAPVLTDLDLFLYLDFNFQNKGFQGNTITFVGDAEVNRDIVKFGGGSLSLPALEDYVTVATDDAINLGSSDFTFEAFVRVPLGSGLSYLYSRGIDSDNVTEVYIDRATGLLHMLVIKAGVTLVDIESTNTVPSNSWTHVAFDRSLDRMRILIGGLLEKDVIYSGALPDDSVDDLYIGAKFNDAANTGFLGYIDEIRMTKGIAEYEDDYPVPTGEFEPAVATVMLLHFEPDTGRHAYVLLEDAQLTDQLRALGDESLQLNGNLDNATVTNTGDEDFVINNQDYTIEFFINFAEADTSKGYFLVGLLNDNVSYYDEWSLMYMPATSNLTFKYFDGIQKSVDWFFAPSKFNQHHVAIVIDSVTSKVDFFLDGLKQGVSMDAVVQSAGEAVKSDLMIGKASNGDTVHGYYDELRLSENIRRYTGNFDVPTFELQSDEFTALLIHFETAEILTDSASINGKTTVDDKSDFGGTFTSPTWQYDQAIGFSRRHVVVLNGAPVITSNKLLGTFDTMQLDGAADYLTIADSDDWDLGNSFTVESFFNPDVLPVSAYTILARWDDTIAGSGRSWMIRLLSSGLIEATVNDDGTSTGTEVTLTSTTVVPIDTWTQVALEGRGGTVYLMINGFAEDSILFDGVPAAQPTVVSVGSRIVSATQDEYFDGALARVRISDPKRYNDGFLTSFALLETDEDTRLLLNLNEVIKDDSTVGEEIPNLVDLTINEEDLDFSGTKWSLTEEEIDSLTN